MKFQYLWGPRRERIWPMMIHFIRAALCETSTVMRTVFKNSRMPNVDIQIFLDTNVQSRLTRRLHSRYVWLGLRVSRISLAAGPGEIYHLRRLIFKNSRVQHIGLRYSFILMIRVWKQKNTAFTFPISIVRLFLSRLFHIEAVVFSEFRLKVREHQFPLVTNAMICLFRSYYLKIRIF